MGFSINLVQINNREGREPVYVRLYKDGKLKYHNTDIRIYPKYWNSKKQKVRSTHDRHIRYNEQLTKKKNLAEDKAFELKDQGKLDLDYLKEILEGQGNQTITEYAKEYHEELDPDQHYWEKRKFGVLRRDLQHFIGDTKILLTRLDQQFLEDFQDYLLSDSKKGKSNSANTVRRKMRRLKGMVKKARSDNLLKSDPYKEFNFVNKESANRETLTLEQVKRIKELDLPKESMGWHVRNYFMFSYYNAGIRFGDICTLTWDNLVDGRLVYQMRKTGTQKDIKQLEPMDKILSHYRTENVKSSDYIFPILDRKYSSPRKLQRKISSNNASVNRKLKKIAKKADIEANISFHVSRHSFSHHAMKKGLDLYQISKALGHSKLETTEEYLKKFDEKHLDEGMQKFIK